MKKTMKWAALPVAVSLMLLTACGASSEGEKSSSPTPAPSTQPATAGPKPELKALMRLGPNFAKDPIAMMLEEKTGYKVNYEALPVDKPEDKLNLLIASSEPYDIVSTAGDSSSKAIYADYAKKGALVDLTPLIEKYGKNIKASLSKETLEMAKVDGKIYAIPTRTLESVGTSLMIRKDWLDKLGLKVPTTLDELLVVLKAFKEKDPGGNGAKNIPMAIKGDNPLVDNLVGAFGMVNDWNDVSGKLVPRAMNPAFKEYLTYMTDLYKQGLLDPEFAINKDATVKEKFTNGKAGAIVLHWADIPSIDDALKKNFPSATYAYIPALTGKDGKAGLAQSSGFDRLTFIPKASKHPEDAIKWMDAKLEPDTFKNMAIGVEGTHHTVKEGNYYPILPIFNDERGSASNYLTGIDETKYPIYWQARVRKDDRLYKGWEFLNKLQKPEVFKQNPLGLAPYFPNYSKENAQLNQMVNDYAVKVIVGGEQLTGFDAFTDKFKKAGGQTSYDEINTWYATTRK
ncbi:extracellular solute-binding protein [Paenibacillus sp. LMG 31461]|uniref:Extracellular solute-binding protein n=1 Tax=Paenibacillus plantarum TaxID=2654975 RepID=A0ABX1XA65_9BACL|nr:extracellular solute-binding protein [Paenibacillus plantarum]NOU65337.1 extracellular solute-binding protein [Paenibacillus plantarum]